MVHLTTIPLLLFCRNFLVYRFQISLASSTRLVLGCFILLIAIANLDRMEICVILLLTFFRIFRLLLMQFHLRHEVILLAGKVSAITDVFIVDKRSVMHYKSLYVNLLKDLNARVKAGRR
jgi:hypothetical protein